MSKKVKEQIKRELEAGRQTNNRLRRTIITAEHKGRLSNHLGARLTTGAAKAALTAQFENMAYKFAAGPAVGKKLWSDVFVWFPRLDELAGLIVSIAIDTLETAFHSRRAVGRAIGKAIEKEVGARELRKVDPRLYNYKVAQANGEHAKKGKLAEALRTVSIWSDRTVFNGWDLRKRETLGHDSLTMLVNIGVFKQSIIKIHGKSRTLIHLTEEARDLLKEGVDMATVYATHKEPMVCPPLPWESFHGGGYLTGHIPSKLIAGQGSILNIPAVINAHINTGRMNKPLRALNAMQDTKWRVNQNVFNVMVQCWEERVNVDSFPKEVEEPVIEKPGWYYAANCEAMTKNEFKHYRESSGHAQDWAMWSGEKFSRTNQYYADKSKVRGIGDMLITAADLVNEECIYIPHFLDFRGRAYASSNRLHHQGDDLRKGILEFAEEKPIGEMGLYWLAVHVANSYGLDKAPFADRVRWVEDNTATIQFVAERPMDALDYWRDVDSPFVFLAACMDYVKAATTGLSSVPVGLDGTCNGLQHYSALLRDRVGGLATNLIWAEKPNDIYGQVAEKTREILTGADPEFWGFLMPDLNRDFVKRCVMTLPYGVTNQGMVNFLADKMKTLPATNLIGDQAGSMSLRMSCEKLQPFVAQAINETVTAAPAMMDWLRQVAQTAGRDGKHLEWTTASGFKVIQAPCVQDIVQVAIKGSDGKLVNMKIAQETKLLDRKACASGIAPNFVHAQDATHMTLTTAAMAELGHDAFAMIHDQFGTHAGAVDDLNKVLRNEFVGMYENYDVVGDLIKASGLINTPEIPDSGTLDVKEVLKSPYFFA